MSERVIAKRLEDYVVGVPKQVEPDGDIDFDQYEAYIADPEAPSVAEIVEVLREAQEAMKWLRSGTDWSTSSRIDNLIARLEG